MHFVAGHFAVDGKWLFVVAAVAVGLSSWFEPFEIYHLSFYQRVQPMKCIYNHKTLDFIQ